jgi:hypothetical protein
MPSDIPSNITIGTTNVSLSNIKNAFLGSTTRLSHYYRGGNNIYNVSRLSTIPLSGSISFGNFKNTTNVIQQTITNSSDATSQGATSSSTHTLIFTLPANKIKIISINYVAFNATISGTRTTIRNILNTLTTSINSYPIAGTLNVNDSSGNYSAQTTITNNYVNRLFDTYDNYVSMQATSIIPSYTNGIVNINLTYIR